MVAMNMKTELVIPETAVPARGDRRRWEPRRLAHRLLPRRGCRSPEDDPRCEEAGLPTLPRLLREDDGHGLNRRLDPERLARIRLVAREGGEQGQGVCTDLGQPHARFAQTGRSMDSGTTARSSQGTRSSGSADLVTTIPPAKGLTKLQRSRVLAAADKLCALQDQANQQPRRKRALLIVLLETGMRISETLRLTMDQFDGKYFRNVKRKGKTERRRLPLARGESGSCRLLRARTGQGDWTGFSEPERLTDAPEGRLPLPEADSGNGERERPPEEHVNLHAHLMRHTALKQAERSSAGRSLRRRAGTSGMQHIERYVQPAREDYEKAMDELYS